MLLLHSLTKNGITILTVLHQPNFQIFMMIDQIMVMGKKGTFSTFTIVNCQLKYVIMDQQRRRLAISTKWDTPCREIQTQLIFSLMLLAVQFVLHKPIRVS